MKLYRKYTILNRVEYIMFRLDKGEFWLVRYFCIEYLFSSECSRCIAQEKF